MPRKSTTFTPQQDSEIIRLRRAGATYKEIAEATGHSCSGVRRRYLQLQKAIAQAKASQLTGNPVLDAINEIGQDDDGYWHAPNTAGIIAHDICDEHNAVLCGARTRLEGEIGLYEHTIAVNQRITKERQDHLEAQIADLEKQVQSLQHENEQLKGNPDCSRLSDLEGENCRLRSERAKFKLAEQKLADTTAPKIHHHLRVDIGAYNAVARALIDAGWHTAFTRDRGVLVLDMNGLGIAVDGGEGDEGEAA